MDSLLAHIQPVYVAHRPPIKEGPAIQALLNQLNLHPHPEGGYFAETDRNPLQIPSPFQAKRQYQTAEHETRAASTAMYYLLTPGSPLGLFHRNLARTIHTWHRGRGRYVIIHADEVDGEGEKSKNSKADIETFVVGPNVECGERMQWIVGGGKYKACFLLPDSPGHDQDHNQEMTMTGGSNGLLISEVGLLRAFIIRYKNLKRYAFIRAGGCPRL